MKYSFYTLLLCLTLCTCGRAQITVEYKNVAEDTARLKAVRLLPDGTEQINYTAWKPTAETLSDGVATWREGGFIGAQQVLAGEADTETAREMLAMVNGMNPARLQFHDELVSAGVEPALGDTLVAQQFVGTYAVNGGSCFGGATVDIVIAGALVELRDDQGFPLSNYFVYVLSPDMFWIGNQGTFGLRLYVRDEENPDTFRTPNALQCSLVKQ